MSWQEVGDRTFRRRFESLDLNCGLVLGDRGAVVIDSRSSHAEGDELAAEIRTVTTAPIVSLINTHHHWDHTFGNARIPAEEIVGHIRCKQTLEERGEEMRQRLIDAEQMPIEFREQLRTLEITPPTVTFETEWRIDLGDRSVDLAFIGNGHTNNDIVISVGGVWFAGDLVEEGAPPQFGDAYPRAWLTTLDDLVARVGQDTIVPGHGDVVDVDFVREQRSEIARAIDGEDVFPEPIMQQLRGRLDAV